MNLKFSFSWVGLLIFALPMFINIAYALFPPAGEAVPPAPAKRWVESIEKVSRMAYLAAVVLLVSRDPLSFRSAWLYMGLAFLALYYIVWIRYFEAGRDIALLNRPFFFVPMPLAVFPVLYYLCAALWLHNLPAAGLMVIFGAAHLAVSIQSFR